MSGRQWTPAEDEVLEAMLGDHGSAAIAKRLGVPVSRVNNRITRLGLSRKVVGVFSANELAALLGIEGNWIRHSLIDTGILPAQLVTGRGRYGITQVTEADLVAFLRAHPHLVDRKKVDAAYQRFVPERWITLGEAFRRGAPHVVSLEHAYRAGFLEQARRRGIWIVIPESLLPELIERRRTRVDDVEARRQYRVYAATQRRRLPVRRESYRARGERLRESA